MISIITPSNNPKWLGNAYDSLAAQTYTDWEWVVLLNGGAKWEHSDPRVKIFNSKVTGSIGSLKREAIAVSDQSIPIILELDHDDELEPTALSLVMKAFNQHSSVFVYSDTMSIDENGEPVSQVYGDYGWRYRMEGDVYVPISFPPFPSNLGHIWWAPNHLRAFRRDAYEAVGGYSNLEVCDDLDLMHKLYMIGEFTHIEKTLYRQRIHSTNSQKIKNAMIQAESMRLYTDDIQELALGWAKKRGLKCLDFGAAHRKPAGYEGVDIRRGIGVDYVADCNERLPFEDDSVGVIRCVDFLEHLNNPVGFMNECYRVLAHGGMMLTLTPSSNGKGAFQDPTHVSFWNTNSFWYYTDANYRAFVPEIETNFIISYLDEIWLSDWHRKNNIPYVCANLVADKVGQGIAGRGVRP